MSLLPRHSLFDFDNFFDHFFPARADQEYQGQFFTPRIDIKDKDHAYEISAELPGVEKKDIHLTLDNGILTLEAELKQEDKEEKDGKLIRQERRYGKFMRSFNVGNKVHEEDIRADFNNGILILTAPKISEAQSRARKIEIGG